ncbi:photosystem II cytochrome c-550 [Sphaerospermopsis sp. LEGE 08334]|uniref:photosystem II cytochrome c-550 n=1 Tax=Sphaerospermopsis sp. LEGE 08334 TaxID=1828651 RepID=UPI00188199B1|nr:photosystem II cytochrome c-550 [Sphaerospermopsis sp. LEGE 08334]MBE9054971.1 cytochrome c-550 [Sphaerospermopsis sp. LEGE 08334]
MFKRLISVVVAAVVLSFQLFIGSATALELDQATRTVKLNEQGDTVVISIPQLAIGKKLFNDTCAQCHAGGVTKTNQNVGLEPEALALATPKRDNIEGLVDYMKNPTTYDGETEISEIHPSIKSADIFTEMRNLKDDDLTAIAGHILIQPKIVGIRWGGGKIHY